MNSCFQGPAPAGPFAFGPGAEKQLQPRDAVPKLRRT